jgi:ElaB/YqjD/DUF883 family membrane-anchored ribosome-binding protein
MNLKDTASRAGASLSRAQEQMEELGRNAGKTLDETRHGTADALDNTASSVRAAGRQGSETLGTFSESAAGRLSDTAAYVRSHDLGGMLADVRQVIGRHPTGFLVVAAGIGFLAGRFVQRNQAHRVELAVSPDGA